MSRDLVNRAAGALRSERASISAIAFYVLISAALFGAVGISLGFLPTALAGATLIIGATLPGAALVRLLMPRASLFHFVILGTVFGLGLWTLGAFLSRVVDLYAARWVPSAAAVLVWLVLTMVRRLPERRSVRRFPAIGAIGASIALVTLIPAIRMALATQPTAWEGWRAQTADLPFQVAIVAEVATRVPDQAPWVAGTDLSYTWAFHGAVGVWSSLSTVTAADLLQQIWPVLYAVLIPGLIAIVAWELSRRAPVAAAAPVVFTLAHGVLFAPTTFVQQPILSVSPTRDFGHLFMLVAVLFLSRTLGRRSLRAASPRWLVALGLAMVIATSAKGSELPILLGGLLSTLFILVVLRRFVLSDLAASGVFAIGSAIGFVIAIPDSNSAHSLGWGPLTFLDLVVPDRPLVSVLIVALLLVAIVAFWVTIRRWGGWVTSTLLAGTMFAGLIGLALLTQSGASQNYFWQATEPLVAITIAWCGWILSREYGLRSLLVAAGVFLVGRLLSNLTADPVLITVGVLMVAAVGATVLLIGRRDTSSILARGLQGIVVALLLTQAAQIVSVPTGYVSSIPSDRSDTAAIHSSQLAAFDYIRTHAGPDDIVVTSGHCLIGTIADGDCDSRRFIVAARTERRVLVEGWSYTQFGESIDWVADRIDLSDRFISVPSPADVRRLIDLGVRFIYVDTRYEFSPDLAEIAELVFSSEWARVYELTP